MGKIADAIADGVSLPEAKRRQMLNLDREFVALESKVQILETENKKLQAEVNPLKREVERLKNQIQQQSTPRAHTLEPSEVNILLFIGSSTTVSVSNIAAGLKMHAVQIEHFLARLSNAGYIHRQDIPMIGPVYPLTEKGFAYIVDNNLLPLAADGESNPQGYHCDHCGSIRLRRAGNRPNPTFGELGIKDALFSCLECGKESAFKEGR
jgi:DNA-binding MarR family transcriptional regulator